MNKKNILLFLIVLVAFILRFYQLSSVPPSVSLDEASIGWNAYSILKTGVDEYGYKFPILLRAYDDWRPALYVYFVIPFVKLLGLNALAVRLPSLILETLTVLATYFLILELFVKFKYKEYLGLLSSFFLAISPWGVYISRLGHEANAGFAFEIFAVYFFLKFKNTFKSLHIYLSSVFFALSFYAYQSEKIFVPLIVCTLLVLFSKKIIQRKKHLLFAFLLGFIILIPVLKVTLSSNGLIRLKGTTAFDINQPQYVHAAVERLKAKRNHDLFREMVNNNRVISAEIFLGNYVSHFSAFWLFENKTLGDFKAPEVGLLYLFSAIFIPVGLLYLLFRKFDRQVKILLIVWILVSPVASSISTGSPQAMRFYNVLPTFQILTSLGLIYLITLIKKDAIRKIFISLVFIIITVNFLYFCRQYFIEFPKENSSSFQYALSQAIVFAWNNNSSFNKIVVSNRNNLFQSYMFFLFYFKYDPVLYQKEGGTGSGGFAQYHTFGKFEFRPINWNTEDKGKGILYIKNISSLTIDPKIFNTKVFSNLDGEERIIAIWKK